MKVVSLILLLIPIFVFQTLMIQDVILDYKLQKKAKRSRLRPIKNIKRNDLYYRIK